jgi:hypothetical protein
MSPYSPTTELLLQSNNHEHPLYYESVSLLVVNTNLHIDHRIMEIFLRVTKQIGVQNSRALSTQEETRQL